MDNHQNNNLKNSEKQVNILINEEKNNYEEFNNEFDDNYDGYEDSDNSNNGNYNYLSENNDNKNCNSSEYDNTDESNNIINHECENCHAIFNDYIALIDHIIIYHDNIFEDEYVDDYIKAKNNNNYQAPKVSNHQWNEYLDLNININEGDYECIICKKKYQSAFLLGEHFTNEHSSYEQQYELDKNIVKDGYPSFDILEQINMISILPYYEINNLKQNDIKCQICSGNYHFPLGKSLKEKKERIIFNDDMIIKKIKYDTKYSYDDLCNYDDIIIDDYELLSFIDDNLNFKFPIKTSCCKNIICNICFIEHLKTKNDIICLFCQKDFNKIDSKYIDFMEFEKTNSSWKKWWINHLDIFY